MTHDSTISPTFAQRTDFGSFCNPAPMIAPVATCVVETGSPLQLARPTSVAVVMLAVTDCASGNGVSLFAKVSSTRIPAKSPPSAMAIATIAKLTATRCEPVIATSPSAAIFGASFHPRAKPTNPPLNQCTAFAAAEVVTATGASTQFDVSSTTTCGGAGCVATVPPLTVAATSAGSPATTHTQRFAARRNVIATGVATTYTS